MRAVRRNHHSSFRRRGVLLLVVLALLAIFGLIAVAFVVLTQHAQRSAKSHQRIDEVSDPPKALLQQALMQILHGPTTNSTTNIPNPASVLGAHSLLEDMYGNNWLSGTISSAGALVGFQQLLGITPTLSATLTVTEIAKRGGCVLTITNRYRNNSTSQPNPCCGKSTRIVALDNLSTGRFQVTAFPDNVAPQAGDTFVINGSPFSGTGFGFKPDANNKWVPDGDLPLQPNATANRNPTGGANSDYTAADFQHMLLAAQVPNGNTINTLPSMHRPELIKYWRSQTGWTDSADSFRNIMLRPIGKDMVGCSITPDHPDFDGSNQKFKPDWDGITTDGQWDVDNDGDGVAESVWVDLGMPVRQMADGRLYKPLFAILCVDLDGRLNLNADGSLAQLDTSAMVSPMSGTATDAGDNGVRGQGRGPAEISLLPLLGNTTLYQQLLTGGTVSGRYGTRNLPGSSNLDLVLANKWFDYGPSYGLNNFWDFTSVNNAGSYNSPPDPYGCGNVTLDTAGHPVYKWTTTGNYGFGSNLNNTPYQLNLDPNAVRGVTDVSTIVNSPFSPAELERLLRPYDRDAPSLPSRLAVLTSSSGLPNESMLLGLSDTLDSKRLHLSFTTESWDPPCPAVSGTDRLLAKLQSLNIPTSAWTKLLPPEVLAGLKMNINAPFGNGKDDNANSVVDENGVNVNDQPDESGEQVTLSGVSSTVSYDGRASSETLAKNPLVARQREARYLYVLACLTADRSKILAMLQTTNSSAAYSDVARFLAQWAVNVVDFRDRDSIMTRFDFDPKFADPSSDLSAGWVEPTDGRHTVFGCERPELLISETLAFHDRRTEDRANEVPDPNEMDAQEPAYHFDSSGATAVPNDLSFDQRYKPQGSLFIELFNPWTSQEPRPRELCKGTVPKDGVDLAKTTPLGSGSTSWPVWRLAIVDAVEDDPTGVKDPDYYDPADTTHTPTIERVVYFVKKDTANVSFPTDGRVQFQPSASVATMAPILPGRYAVIGPGEPTDTSSSITVLGYRNGQTPNNSANMQRHITLRPNSDPEATNQVEIYNNGSSDELAQLTSSIQRPVSLIINSPARLSISEPNPNATTGYTYTNVSPNGMQYVTSTGYTKPWDIPLDRNNTATHLRTAIQTDGRTDNVKIVYLQRLANPLKPYNNAPTSADYNPYRTIDRLQADLFAFNGLLATDNDPAVSTASGDQAYFYARQRGQNNGTAVNNPWRQEDIGTASHPKANDPAPTIPTNFNLHLPLHHTTGYLNNPFGQPSNVAIHKGDPQSPFPWLTWNNRPYVSPLELMQAPWLKSSQLLTTFKMANAGDNPYTNSSQPFSHLMNFFPSGLTGSSTNPPNEELHRMFEYLGVPSAFVGSETWANPTSAAAATGHTFHPPFNRISAYRDPGKINLNTIYTETVFRGLMAGVGYPTSSNARPTWEEFIASRRGSTGSILDPPSGMPTAFVHPFRSFSGANLVPTLSGTVTASMAPTREINATLLREGPTAGQPLFNYISTSATDNTDRNPYFRYQALQRLSNLTTTRSNVYAVWITVGYFEVTPAPSGYNTAIYPDGYRLGRELGLDTGEVERHRAFYIIDRSIPVGFQRGQDLNVEKAIILNRFIE
jgi:hypothetical protein